MSERYSRQILFEPIGRAGQEKLRDSKAVIVGVGALGTAHANALVRAGLGRLRLVDRDYVEESNLHRQILFDEQDAARNLPKAVAAEQKLRQVNSGVEVEGVVADLDSGNAERLLEGFDVILDGTDNFEARYLLNDVSLKLGIPWVYGAVVSSYATTLTVLPGRTACLACVYPEPPRGLQETCDTVGVISTAVSWTAAVQVTEALKVLLKRERELHGALLAYDIWKDRSRRLQPKKDPGCRACGARDFVYLRARASAPVILCGRNAVQVRPPGAGDARDLDLEALRNRLERLAPVRANAYLLQCQLESFELTIFRDGRAIIKGTEDPAIARSLYARYVGS